MWVGQMAAADGRGLLPPSLTPPGRGEGLNWRRGLVLGWVPACGRSDGSANSPYTERSTSPLVTPVGSPPRMVTPPLTIE